MLKLTSTYNNIAVFLNPSDVVAVQQTYKDCTMIHTNGNHIFEVIEPAEDIVRYIIQKRSYNGTFNKYDTLSEVVIEKNDDNFDALTEALEFAEFHLRDKIEKYKEEKTNPFQSKYYQELIEHFHKLSKSIVSVTVREIE